MKKLSAVLMGMVLLCFFAANTPAQGFLGSDGTSNSAGFPFRLAGNVVGTGDIPGRGLVSAPTLYLGWLEHSKGNTWALQRQDSTGTAPWPLKGFWLGASKDFSLDNGFGLLVSGSVFFPQRSAGTWFRDSLGRSFDFEIPSYDWWSLDGLLKGRMFGDLEALAGFRWDHTSTRVNYSDNTEDDYILNAYVPLFGLQIRQPFSSGCVLVRFVGSPWVGGRLKYHYWDRLGFAEFGDFDVRRGTFMEFFMDYSVKTKGNLSLGGFAKWNALHVKTAEASLSGSTTDPVAWSVNIRSWTVGGTVSLGFSSPL
ncbi:MAG: hypothetical protein HY913_04165 [Desulfomonile tiedjei]|nr:hypothetical protein [Desulfomonile tiedjei]